MKDEFNTLTKFDAGNGREGFLYSLPALEEQGIGKISRLPVSIRIVLESVLRNCDGKKVRRKDVETLANWNAKSPANAEIPFVVARIVLQDFTGVPLVVDLAAIGNWQSAIGNLLSRHLGRHRFAHDDDQWSRRGRLGRRRNRSGGWNARTTGLFFDAGSRGCAHERAVARRRYRHRSRLAHHAVAPCAKSRRQICRVLRRRRGIAASS